MTVTSRTIRIGTRGSALARVQATLVRDALVEAGHAAELHVVVTDGDVRAPDTAWGEGAFVGAIERALLDDAVDVAVHSAKDVPTDEDPRLSIAAFLPRADPRDVVVLPATGRATLEALPAGARVGTDSPRRSAFLRAIRPDLDMRPIHGNVDTRLRRLDEGQADALVLAAAGLERLGRLDRATVTLDPGDVPPAPGQGALAVQVRAGDVLTRQVIRQLDHLPTRHAVEVERAILAGTGGGCRAPVGALADVDGDRVDVVAGFAQPDGRLVARTRHVGSVRDRAGVVARVLAQLATEAMRSAAERSWPEIIITRPLDQAAGTVLALVDAGFAPRVVPAISIRLRPDGRLAAALLQIAQYDWVLVTSVNAVRAVEAAALVAGIRLHTPARSHRPRWAAVGRATARALTLAGRPDALRPALDSENGRTIAEILPITPGQRVLVPHSSLAGDGAVEALRARGAIVDVVTAYDTEGPPSDAPELLASALVGKPRAVVAASPSAVAGLLQLAAALSAEDRVRAMPVIVPGATTARAAGRAGFTSIHLAQSPAPADIAAAARSAAGVLQEVS